MKKGLAYVLVGLLSFSMLQMPVRAYENAESEIVIEASEAASDDETEAGAASSDSDSVDEGVVVSEEGSSDEQGSEAGGEENDEAAIEASDILITDDATDSASTLNTSSVAEAPDDEEILGEGSFYSESDLFYGSYSNAASMLASMDIVAINGRTYHISDFSEDYICVFFGRSGCGNTNAMTQEAARIRDAGGSVRIVVMDVDNADDGLSDFASNYSVIASLNPPYNSNMMWKLYKTAIGGSSSVTLPVTFVLDADRNVAYAQTGYDVTGLRQTLAGNDPTNYSDDIHEYEFVMKYGQSEARSMLSDVNALRTGSEAWAWDSSNTTKVHYDASPLAYDYGLELNAMKRAAEIAIYYSHTRPNGESCFTAYTVQRGAHAENIAMGYPSADSVFEAWCENDENYSGQGHRRNMLGSYSYIGIGHVFFNGTHFWVQEFSTAPTDLTKSTAFDSNTVVTIEILDSLIEGSSYLLDSYDYNLKKGESDTLPKVYKTLTVPNGTVNVEEVQPTWSISDKKVATISGNKIKAVGGGKAKLTASYDNWTDYIFINVTAEVESITLNKTSLSLTVGDSEKLKATVLPADANDKSVYWYSSNSSVASVGSDGTVTAKKKGTATITVYSSNNLTAECAVTVNANEVSYPNGLNKTEDGWYLFENNKVKTSFSGLYEDARYGWWLVLNGRVALEFNDFYCDKVYGWWKIAGGSVDFGFTDFYNSPTYGWWKVNGGAVDFGFTDLYESPTYGWWKVNGGAVDFGFTDLYESPRYGWWKVNGGAVDFGFTDLYGSPVYGWWLVDGGMVDFSYNDIFKSPSYGYWKVAGGTVDFGYTGTYNSPRYGRCKVRNGAASF